MSGIAFCAVMLACALSPHAAPLPSDWQHVQQLEVAAPGLVKLSLPAATLDAALLKRLGDSGQLGPCIVDGPLSMDNALDGHTAEVKGRAGPVSGKADILVAPDIETANAVYKTIRYMARREIAGTVFGASAPAVVSSRSDSATSKLYSIALAVLLSRQFEHDH